jgi:hypothetical protein
MTQKRLLLPPLVLAIIDLENLLLSLQELILIEWPDPRNALSEMKKWIESIGPVYEIYVFAPSHVLFVHEETLSELGFTPIICPKIKTESGKKDTTDDEIKKQGGKWIKHLQGITHLVLGSGDGGFAEMLEQAKAKGIQVGIAASSPRNLSEKLKELADKDPRTKEKMIFFLEKHFVTLAPPLQNS